MNVRFDVAASAETAAFREALGLVRQALPHGETVRIEMQTVDELERQLAESNVPACAAPAPDRPQG